ncbi:MAG TPA: DUF2336 domain-containing protein [Stellaceae bacterium]|nr:DUF2336 domain-containing protein [Stellaceae bacterium]
MTVSTRDVAVQFNEERSWTERAKTVDCVATLYAEGALDGAESEGALALFRLALYDAEPLVRRVLAESVKHARDLPREIVRGLIADSPEVSTPFLAASPLLEEGDLLAIAIDGSSAQRAAIAARANLPRRVKRALRQRASAA